MSTSDSGQEPPAEDAAQPTAEATEDNQDNSTKAADEDDAGQGEEPEETPAPAPPSSALSLAITELVQDSAKLKDRLLRTAADFENYRKRARRDMNDRVKQAEERVFLDVLSVADNLERALAHAEDVQGDAKALKDGVEMVYKQYLTTLERYNIRPIDAVGRTFDPERHEAIQQIFSDEELGTITFEMRRGYVRGDRLVRASMVVVSKGPAPEEEPPPEPEEVADEPEAPPMEPDEGGTVDEVVVTEEDEDAALAMDDDPIQDIKPLEPEAG